MEKVYFQSSDGTKLCGVWHKPSVQTAKAVLLVHGITADKDEEGIYIELAELLKENGYSVLRFDFRAHGESEGESVKLTIQSELQDLDAAFLEITKAGYLVGVVAASFGGGVAALYFQNHSHKIKALCLWNPCLNFDHCFLTPQLPWMKNKIDQIQKDFQKKGWSRLGSREFKVSKELFEEMKTLYPYEALKKLSIPTVIIHGDNDRHVPYDDSKEYVQNLPQGSLIRIEGSGHGFQDDPTHRAKAKHETLNFLKKYL